MNSVQKILDRFPPLSVNNSRSIVRKMLNKMKGYPSERQAKKLENLGIDIDWRDEDYGEPKIQQKYDIR